MITLRPISKDNFWDCIDLAVHPEQQSFVTSNAISIAQSKVQPECIPLAIYHEDVMVGFVMYCLDTDDDEYWIYRLMIDEKYQSRGYGRRVLEMLVEKVKQEAVPDHHVLYLSFEPDNEWGRKLYTSLGFVDDGRMDHGEIVFRLDF